jgi:hypothetical protein
VLSLLWLTFESPVGWICDVVSLELGKGRKVEGKRTFSGSFLSRPWPIGAASWTFGRLLSCRSFGRRLGRGSFVVWTS